MKALAELDFVRISFPVQNRLCSPWVLTQWDGGVLWVFYYKDANTIHEDSALSIQSLSKVLPPNIITLGVDPNI